MSRSRYVSDVKLCLEMLSRFNIYPDLGQLECFLEDKTKRDQLNDCAEQIMQAWIEKMGDCLTHSCPLDELFYSTPEQLAETPTVCLEKQPSLPEFSESNPQETQAHPTTELDPVNLEQPTTIRFKLPNATVGKPYQGQLEWIGIAPIKILEINGLDELGLNYDLSSNTLSGEPKKSGEYVLTISYQQQDAIVKTKELSFVINSNPKSLWKDIPSDKNCVFWKPDSDYQGKIGINNWKLIASSKRGRSHAHVGNCRDDDFAMKVDSETLWHIISVADGAGSCEYSREGSRIVAHNSVEVLSSQLQQTNQDLDWLIKRWLLEKSLDNEIALQQVLVDLFAASLSSSIQMITDLAKQQQVSYRDFYSTLLIAIHKSFPEGEFIASYWIGDGGFGLYSAGEKIELLGDNDSGEYAGQTRFLDKNALETDDLFARLHFCSEQNFTALILMTDGITDPLFETDNNLRALSYWNELWQQIQPQLDVDNPQLSAEKLTEWLSFWSPGNHDDRTIALLYR